MLLVNELEDSGKARQMVLSGKARAALVYACFRALDDFHRLYVCWRMLAYADVCWRILAYADVC